MHLFFALNSIQRTGTSELQEYLYAYIYTWSEKKKKSF